MTLGERASDGLARVMGSWKFVLLQFTFLLVWFVANIALGADLRWDPYPFILANLVMSAQAAFATPIILMSSNRAAERDTLMLERDVKLDQDSLDIIKRIEERVDGLVPRREEVGVAAGVRCSACDNSDTVHPA